jgi:hypothetical protein
MSYEVSLPAGIPREAALSFYQGLMRGTAGSLHKNFAVQIQSILDQKAETSITPQKPLATRVGEAMAELAFGIFTGPMGCTPVESEKPAQSPTHDLKAGEVSIDGNLSLRLDLDGDPRVGKLLFIRNARLPPDVEDIKKISSASILAVGRYQEEVFKLLNQLKPQHLFVDGLVSDIPPGSRDPLKELFSDLLKKIQQHYSENDNPQVKEERNLIMLAFLGASYTYAMLHPEIYLHKTETNEEYVEFVKKYQELTGMDIQSIEGDENFIRLLKVQSEKWVTQELVEFYRAHPGESAALIYRAGFNFCDDFVRSGVKPKMYSTWWDLPEINVSSRVSTACL